LNWLAHNDQSRDLLVNLHTIGSNRQQLAEDQGYDVYTVVV